MMNELAIRESSNIIKYEGFGILSAKRTIWIPETGKSIYLTAVQGSAPLSISILLSNGDNNFLSLRITEPFTTVRQGFFSPFKLDINTPLMVSTSDESISCDIFGGANATQVNYNGRSDFSNINNAVGPANGSVASLNSGLIVQTSGRIVLGYNLPPSEYNNLEIEQVIIKFYCRLGLTVAVGVSSMILYWRPNPLENWIQLQQISLSLIGTVNHLTTPIEYDITDMVLESSNPWEVINNLQTSFVGIHTGLGLGNVIQLDAIEIEICVHGKNQITVFGYEE
jgi:hypothetical protein